MALSIFSSSSFAQLKQDTEKAPQVNTPPRAELPKQNAEIPTVAPVNPDSYILGPEDVIFIKVFNEPQFTGPAVVRPDGKITLPLVGDLTAAGLTPAALAAELTKQLLNYLTTKPSVNVIVEQVNSRQYFITGEVNRTGSFPLVKPTTVLDALGLAGGFKEFANLKKILIMRGTSRLYFNYKQVIAGKKLDQNIQLEPGDYILVK